MEAEWVRVQRTGEASYFWNRADDTVLWDLPDGARIRYHQKFLDEANRDADAYFICVESGKRMKQLPPRDAKKERTRTQDETGELEHVQAELEIERRTNNGFSSTGEDHANNYVREIAEHDAKICCRAEAEEQPVKQTPAMAWLNSFEDEPLEQATADSTANTDDRNEIANQGYWEPSKQTKVGSWSRDKLDSVESLGSSKPVVQTKGNEQLMQAEVNVQAKVNSTPIVNKSVGSATTALCIEPPACTNRMRAVSDGKDSGSPHEVFRKRVHQLLSKEKLGITMSDLAWKWQETWPSDCFEDFKPCKKVKDCITKYVDGVTVWNSLLLYIDNLPVESSPLTDPSSLRAALEQARMIKDMERSERIQVREVFKKVSWKCWTTVYQNINVGLDTPLFRCVLSVVLPHCANVGCATSSPLVGRWALCLSEEEKHDFTVSLEKDVLVYRESQDDCLIFGILHRVELDDWWETKACDQAHRPIGRIRLRLSARGVLDFRCLREGLTEWESDVAYPSKIFFGFGEGPIMSMTAAAHEALNHAPPDLVQAERAETKSNKASVSTKAPQFKMVKPLIELALKTSESIRNGAQDDVNSAPQNVPGQSESTDIDRLHDCIEEMIAAVSVLLVGSESSGEAVPITDPNWASSPKLLLLAWQYVLSLRDPAVVQHLIGGLHENLQDMIRAATQEREVQNGNSEKQWWMTGSPDGLTHEQLEINKTCAAKLALKTIGVPILMFEELLEHCAWSLVGKSSFGKKSGDEIVKHAILQLQPNLVPPSARYASHFMQLLYLERCEELKTSFDEADSEANSFCLIANLPIWNGVWNHTGMHRSDLELVLPPDMTPFRTNGVLRRGDLVMVFPHPPVQGEGFIASVRADFDKDRDTEIKDGTPQKMKLKVWAVTIPEPPMLKAYKSKQFFVQIMSSSSTVTHTRQIEAVKHAIRETNSGYNPNVRKLITESWRTGTGVGDIENECDGSSARALSGMPPTDVSTKDMSMSHVPLTNTQHTAVEFSLSRTCTLIRGPPGTGKTHTACAIVSGWLSAKDARVLVVTQSNVAALNIYERLEQFDIPCVRIGFGMAPYEMLSQRYFVSLFTEDELKVLQDAADDSPLRGRRTSNPETKETVPFWAITSLLQKAARLSSVVVMTCISSGNANLLNQASFNRVLLDEAAQAPEPTSLVPLLTGAAAFACVGDDKQLPATVMSYEAKKRGFDESLFARLLRQRVVDAGDGFVQLDVQRRMHSSISFFPSEMFYEGGVQNGCKDQDRPPIPGFYWPNDFRVCFVQCSFRQYGAGEQSSGRSTQNRSEAELVSKILSKILQESQASWQNTVAAKDIAVITGYSAQRELLKQYIKSEIGDKIARKIRIDTVDGFQGMERDLVLVSTTRSNHRGDVGFLRDARRANVLLTRARRGLIIVGDGETLSREQDIWKPWLSFVSENGGLIDQERLCLE